MESKSLSIDLLRHGDTTAGASFIGSTDAALIAEGWQQMNQAVGDHVHYDAIISSPLIRCHAFAEKFAAKNKIPLIVEDNFREIFFGEWEGQTSESVWEKDSEALLAFWQDPVKYPATGGESIEKFHNRVLRTFLQLPDKHPDQQLLLVAHGGTIRSILTWLLGSNLRHSNRINIAHGGLSRIRIAYDDDGFYPVLEFLNR
jgi:broad specificity phosphatase PhoE